MDTVTALSFQEIKTYYVPTIMLMNHQAIVQHIWEGQLPEEIEKEVLQVLFSSKKDQATRIEPVP